MYLKEIWGRISNTPTIMAITAEVLTILTLCGVVFDRAVIKIIVLAICQILVFMGVINKDGMETTKWNK